MSEDKNTKHLWKKRTICNNCGVQGHMFFSCKRPIMSFGIICYRINPNNNMKIEYLMIRRKDTLGYVEFLRGKYNIHNDFHIRLLVQEMTYYEIDGILNNDYSQLWSNLWNKKNESYDQKIADKFNYIKNEKAHILTNPNAWDEPEWGFPKGRRNNRESDYECSIREFEEETGLDWRDHTVTPRFKDEKKAHQRADKAEDPLSKRGPVGDFCRAYDIQGAMGRFIPDIY